MIAGQQTGGQRACSREGTQLALHLLVLLVFEHEGLNVHLDLQGSRTCYPCHERAAKLFAVCQAGRPCKLFWM
jgi:hypothetical protein